MNKHYAQAHSPHYSTTPRAFLLSLASIAPPHALLVAHWGSEGSAVLSLPTKEYFQSSGWVEEKPLKTNGAGAQHHSQPSGTVTELRSVRSGSDFWAGGPRSRTPSSSAFTAGDSHYLSDGGNDSGIGHSDKSYRRAPAHSRGGQGNNSSGQYTTEDDDNDSQGTETPGGENDLDSDVVDEVGSQDAFIAGMIFALSRRICPGSPYTPSWTGEDPGTSSESERGRWRLDECLRFVASLFFSLQCSTLLMMLGDADLRRSWLVGKLGDVTGLD